MNLNIFRWILNFLKDYNFYYLIKDLILITKLKKYFNKYIIPNPLFNKLGLIVGWASTIGFLVKVDVLHEYFGDQTKTLITQVKKSIIPVIDFISEKSPDVQNLMDVTIKPTNDIDVFKVFFTPRTEIFRLGLFIKYLITFLLVLLIINYESIMKIF